MTREEIAALLSRGETALSGHDAAALAEEHAEDCVMDSAAGGVVTGRDALRQVYAAWFQVFPDLSVATDPPIIDRRWTRSISSSIGRSQSDAVSLVRWRRPRTRGPGWPWRRIAARGFTTESRIVLCR